MNQIAAAQGMVGMGCSSATVYGRPRTQWLAGSGAVFPPGSRSNGGNANGGITLGAEMWTMTGKTNCWWGKRTARHQKPSFICSISMKGNVESRIAYAGFTPASAMVA